eukprot:scaffold571038_cov75-Attheya_sp.AAC.1
MVIPCCPLTGSNESHLSFADLSKTRQSFLPGSMTILCGVKCMAGMNLLSQHGNTMTGMICTEIRMGGLGLEYAWSTHCENSFDVIVDMIGDVKKPRNLSSEPAEHEFGNYRTKIREFTTLDVCHLAKNTQLRSNMMLFSNLIPTRDPQKGYHQATHSDWVRYNKTSGLLLEGGPVPISAVKEM